MTRLAFDVLVDTIVTVLCIGLFLLGYFTLTEFPAIPDDMWMFTLVPLLGLYALLSTFYVSYGNYRRPVAYFTYEELPMEVTGSAFLTRNLKYYLPKTLIHTLFITLIFAFANFSVSPVVFFIIFAVCYYLNRVILMEKKIYEKRVR